VIRTVKLGFEQGTPASPCVPKAVEERLQALDEKLVVPEPADETRRNTSLAAAQGFSLRLGFMKKSG